MRIISGQARGRNLFTLKGTKTRPTADRVKEAMFSSLADRVAGAKVLDAFAGSAALGLEALSRGADRAWFIEADRQAADICRRNIDQCGFGNTGQLLRGDCFANLSRLREQQPDLQFDLVFADPPYNRGLLPRLLIQLQRENWLSPDGLLVAETTAAESEFALGAEWQILKSAVYGQTAVYYCALAEIAE